MKISVIEGEDKGNFKPVAVEKISSMVPLITKTSYSLGTFSDNCRRNENFIEANFLGLDFDGGLSLDKAKDIFGEYEHIIATTRNHQKEKNNITCDRFRVLLKPSEKITKKEDYTATILHLLSLYPDADPKCKDAARFFYPSGVVVSVKEGGKTIPVKKWVKPETPEIMVPDGVRGKLARATVEFLAYGAPEGAWNGSLFKAAKDYQEQGYSKEEAISALQRATKEYDGELDSRDLDTIDSAYSKDPEHPPRGLEDMLDLKHPLEISKNAAPVSWLTDGLLIDGGISLFVGAPKSGKSTLTRQLAMAVSRGGPFLGRKCRKGKVIYLALEENESLIGEQLKKLGLEKSDTILMHVGPIQQSDPAFSLRKSIEAYQADLVIVDTMVLMLGIDDINNYNQVYNKVSPYRDMARETGCHITMIHHKNKGDSTRADSASGTSGLSGAVDCTFVLNETNNREFRFVNTAQRGGKPFTNQKIKYIVDLDMYELSKDTYEGSF